MRTIYFTLCFFSAMFFALPNAYAKTQTSSFSKVIYFGDSLTDVGNYTVNVEDYTNILPAAEKQPCIDVPAPRTNLSGSTSPYKNGYLWTDYLSEDLGLGEVTAGTLNSPSGNDWAWSGAETYLGNDNVPSVKKQVDDYLESNQVDPDALYIIWVGSNDLKDQILTPEFSGQNMTLQQIARVIQYGTNAVEYAVLKLHHANAKNIIVLNVPDMSQTPLVVNAALFKPGVQSEVAQLVSTWNVELKQKLDGIKAIHPKINLRYMDIFSVLDIAINDRTAPEYGFPADIDGRANNAQSWCQNYQGKESPDDFLFFDLIHPTTHSHKIIADKIEQYCFGGESNPYC